MGNFEDTRPLPPSPTVVELVSHRAGVVGRSIVIEDDQALQKILERPSI